MRRGGNLRLANCVGVSPCMTQVLCSNYRLPCVENDSKVAFNRSVVDAGELFDMLASEVYTNPLVAEKSQPPLFSKDAPEAQLNATVVDSEHTYYNFDSICSNWLLILGHQSPLWLCMALVSTVPKSPWPHCIISALVVRGITIWISCKIKLSVCENICQYPKGFTSMLNGLLATGHFDCKILKSAVHWAFSRRFLSNRPQINYYPDMFVYDVCYHTIVSFHRSSRQRICHRLS